MTNSHDVIVVGGGPSGLSTAKSLAEKGLDVLVLEKKTAVGRDIICTGIVGTELFKSFDVRRNSILNVLQKVRVVSPFKTSIDYEHPFPFAYVVDREKFDSNLALDARNAGVVIMPSTKVLDVVVDRNEARVIAESAADMKLTYKAKMVVLATGINYTLSRKLDLGYSKDFLTGIQVELDRKDVCVPTILVGKRISPGAFAWAVPSNGKKARIGLVTRRHSRKYLKRLIDELFPDVSTEMEGLNIRPKLIAQGFLRKSYGDRILAVGEAAGQVKTTTGGGLYYGMLCAQIAADVIEHSFVRNAFRSSNLAAYETSWKKVLNKEIKIGYYARKICGGLSDRQIESFFQVAKSDGIIPLIKEKGNFDWHSSLIFALAKRLSVRSIQVILSVETSN